MSESGSRILEEMSNNGRPVEMKRRSGETGLAPRRRNYAAEVMATVRSDLSMSRCTTFTVLELNPKAARVRSWNAEHCTIWSP